MNKFTRFTIYLAIFTSGALLGSALSTPMSRDEAVIKRGCK